MATPKHADAWRHTYGASLRLASQFLPTDWDRPTDCPAWTVRDIVAHLIGAERWSMGEPLPDYELPDLPHVRTDFDRWTEIPVVLRRGLPPSILLEEFEEVYELRSAHLDTLDTTGEAMTPWGHTAPLEQIVATRVFDCWAHEQDLRRAVGRPGNLDSPAARLSRSRIVHTLPRVVAHEAQAVPGQIVRFDVTGALPFTTDVTVDPDGIGVPGAPIGRATVTLSADWAVFSRLCCGRIPANRAPVTYTGDVELGLRVAQSLALTP
jgi:uncharacterized protein (TIGR03083 family)